MSVVLNLCAEGCRCGPKAHVLNIQNILFHTYTFRYFVFKINFNFPCAYLGGVGQANVLYYYANQLMQQITCTSFDEVKILWKGKISNKIFDALPLHQSTAASTWWCGPRPRLGWVEMAVGLPEGFSYPGHSPTFFRYAAP